MRLPAKTLEKNLFKSGYRLIYAVDEVGMGCLAGPVVVCAVAFKKKFFNRNHRSLRWLRDSKLLQAKQREEYAQKLMSNKDIQFKLAYAHSQTIDRFNIYNAARKAMKRAIYKLSGSCPSSPHGYSINFRAHGVPSRVTPPVHSIVLVDGRTRINGLKMEQLPIVKGDRKVFAIACASIIAKVHRDKMMARYAKKYPGYGFEKHKGYGTKYHQVRLTSMGPCEIHRRSFRLRY